MLSEILDGRDFQASLALMYLSYPSVVKFPLISVEQF